jgi:hypothetical protein
MRRGPTDGFRPGVRGNNDDVHADPQILTLMALTSGVGWLMVETGVFKQLLERRRARRVCPSCGRDSDACACS